MFSQKKVKKKGGYGSRYTGLRQIFQTKIFSLKNRICIRMCETREGIACPLFSQKGSMTVETALVLPLFLLFCLTVLSFVDVMKMTIEQQMRHQELLRTGAVYATLLETTTEGREGDYIKLDYVYAMSLPVGGLGYKKVLVRQRSMVHIFNGYDDTYGDRVGQQQEYVYVTKEGSVYHKKRSCRYLHVNVRQVSGKRIKHERNTEQKKYWKCQICARGYTAAEIGKMELYVTDYGVRYHVRAGCSELTRTVQVIKIEEAGGRRVCRLCG